MIPSQRPTLWSVQYVLGTVGNQLRSDRQTIEDNPDEVELMHSLSQRSHRLHADDSYIAMDCHVGKRSDVQATMPQSDTDMEAASESPTALS